MAAVADAYRTNGGVRRRSTATNGDHMRGSTQNTSLKHFFNKEV